MTDKRLLVAIGALSGALAGCSAEMDPPDSTNTPVPSATGGSIGGGGPPTSGGGGSGGTGNVVPPKAGAPGTGGVSGGGACTPGVPSTSQIPRLKNRQYDAVVRDLLGVTATADGRAPSAGLYTDYDGPMNTDAWRLYKEVGAKVAAAVMSGTNKTKFIGCEPAMAGCMSQTITDFGRKAFRRPLTEAEITRFEKLGADLAQANPAPSAAQIAEATLEAFLVSPSFLQITELTTESEGSAYRLSPFEVAARLSFLLWGSVPDDELNAAADGNLLASKDQILTQAKRMIAVRAKTGPMVTAFHRNYAAMDDPAGHWWKPQHDTAKFPLYSAAAQEAMPKEMDLFFEEVAFNGGSFKDLFTSNVGFVNKDTAPIYGLDPASYTTEMTKVSLDENQRPGFLTRIGFLSSFSRYDGTSPLLRGAFITINLIGLNPGSPPPEAAQTPLPAGTFLTQRALFEEMTKPSSCTGCHTPFINPPGWVLENYDSIGKWQTIDPLGGAIDATATVTFSPTNKQSVSSAKQMMDEIAKGEEARRIYAEKWVSFAYARPANSNDACVVGELDAKLANEGYTVLQLLADLTQADSFRLRVKGS
jgi:Protein of unknown function (DUF1592)/Protein of unknown function (DUF1588)/Protein of unknown function (DUF1585)/Protein of unknown function (DUF1595)